MKSGQLGQEAVGVMIFLKKKRRGHHAAFTRFTFSGDFKKITIQMRKTIFRFVRHNNGNPGWGRWADPMTKSRVQVLKESTIFSEDKIEDSDNEILNVDDIRISNRLLIILPQFSASD